jgi:hypothetical protein
MVEGTDYTVTYTNNTEPGEATVTVAPVTGGNYTFTSASTAFTIARGVKLEGCGDSVYVNGIAHPVEDGILWLEGTETGFITTHDYANAGETDPHLIYPTAMYVWELTIDANGVQTARRIEELDNVLQYSGTSIRITGNQGIRFITSVPAAQRASLIGGKSGYKLMEYGTLFGWYSGGTDLQYGVNAQSTAYSRTEGIDKIFQQAGGMIQYTGMLTDLNLEQSTLDLVTRPYMVLQRTTDSGETEQVVLYGGSIVRSIGYVGVNEHRTGHREVDTGYIDGAVSQIYNEENKAFFVVGKHNTFSEWYKS